ncbi:MAG: trypsin-like peptidase domain-containing protein, partial [Bdellovibrionota bacterium]
SATTVQRMQAIGLDDFFQLWGIPQERRASSLGTGFIVDSEAGYVVTNHHVVAHASEVNVVLHDKRTFRAKVLGMDEKLDLALLQLRTKDRKVPQNLVSVPFADSDKVRIAESVFAVGNPFGLQHTVTTGIISAKNRTIGQGPFDNFLQTDASINPGNSGGPLFNLKGEVIGINTQIISRTGQSSGVGLAIPANDAKAAIPDFKRYGRIPRPWLGILAETVTPAMAEYYNLPTDSGILVFKLVQGGPAHAVGVKTGDIITAFDGVQVSDQLELERSLVKKRPGTEAALRILNSASGKTRTVKISLPEHPPMGQLPKGII